MFTRTIKNKVNPTLNYFLKTYKYNIASPLHRRYYAEMIFYRFCRNNEVMAFKINKNIDVLDQIRPGYLKKIQAKELKKFGRIPLDFFCVERDVGYFVILKMGYSSVNKIKIIKNKVFLVRIFDDGDLIIKNLTIDSGNNLTIN